MAANIPITLTKISIPRRRKDLFSRTRLLDTLNECIETHLTIIAAPAGYGKTSLLIDFSHQSRLPICWLSLDTLDRDLIHFLSYLIHAIKQRFPTFGAASLAALEERSDESLDIEQISTVITNDLLEHVLEHFILILDDYHLLESNQRIEQFISRFIHDVDENCHLVIASRALLTLPDLPVMVAKAQVSGLSYEELAFTVDEIQSIYKKNYHQLLDEETTRHLITQTEGWITGLILAAQVNDQEAINLERIKRVTGFSLYDYLAGQVFLKQTDEIRKFLMLSSLLEEFDAHFCRQILHGFMGEPDPDWTGLVSYTMQSNLFTLPVGQDQIYIRYHPLFAQFLVTKALREFPDESNKILLRLAVHFRDQKDWLRAHDLFLRIGDHESLVSMLVEDGPEINSSGHLVLLTEWLEECTEQDFASFPQLLSLLGSVKGMRGQIEDGLACLDKAIPILHRRGPETEYVRALLRRSDIHRLLGNYKPAILDASRALKITQDSKSLLMPRAKALRALGIGNYLIGSFGKARANLQESLVIYEAHKDTHNVALVSMELGLVLSSLGEYQRAEKVYNQALQIWTERSNPVWQANLANNLGVLYHQTGQFLAGIDMLDRGFTSAKQGGYPRMEAYCLSSIGDIYCDLGATNEAEQAYIQARTINAKTKDHFLSVNLSISEAETAASRSDLKKAESLFLQAIKMADADGSDLEIALTNLHYGRFLIVSGNPFSACAVLRGAVAIYKRQQDTANHAVSLLYLAVAEYLLGDHKEALPHLNQSLAISQVTDTWNCLSIPAEKLRSLFREMSEHEGYGRVISRLQALASDFEDILPGLRRQIRQRNRIVPLAPPRLIIRGLGAMQVKLNNQVVTNTMWISQVSRDLFFYLLHHSTGISKEQVGLSFWPDSDPDDVKIRFKNGLYRLRRAIGREVVLFEEDIYSFNRQVDYEYDVEQFQDEIYQAGLQKSNESKYNHLAKALELYKGSYLPNLDIPEVNAERERLQLVYITASIQSARLANALGNQAAAIQHCHQAIHSDPYNETLYQVLFQSHAMSGNKVAIQKAYKQLEAILQEDLGISPSSETIDLFRSLNE